MLGIISLFLPINATIGDVSLVAMSTFIGFGSAVTLWVTGLRIWMTMLKKLKQ
nr:hypothetical protein [Paenibacillus allorhizoplanae]